MSAADVVLLAVAAAASLIFTTLWRRPAPGACRLIWDERAVVAAALLQPDHPLLTDAQLAQLHADEIGDEAEAWLRDRHTQEH